MRYWAAIFVVAVILRPVVQAADVPPHAQVRAPHAKNQIESACEEQALQHSGFPNMPGGLEVLCSGATSSTPATCAYEAAQRGVQGWDNIAILCQRAAETAVDKPSICAQTAAQQGFHGWDNVAVLCHGATDDAPTVCAKQSVSSGAIGWENVALMCRRPLSFSPLDNHPDPVECANYLIKSSDFKSWFTTALVCARSTL
jgi:hypothetical protein